MGDNKRLIVRQRKPENLESPPAALESYLTPTGLFFVRSHFELPKIQLETWRLRLAGAVERALEFSYGDLLAMPQVTVTAAIECAGNGRAHLPKRSKGVQWLLGAVGNAEWTGVPLAELLKRAGVQLPATTVVLQGADSGSVDEEPKTPGAIHYTRSLPLKKANEPQVLLAHSMNGMPLAPRHGFPLRAIVPGWYGMASVKWLEKIAVSDRPVHGYFESFEYSHWIDEAGFPALVPVGAMNVKAQILRPAKGERVKRNEVYRVSGIAWAGESEVRGVEVSADAGRSWSSARLLDNPERFAWTRWEFDWRTPNARTSATLLARATDTSGHSQPNEHNPAERHYSIHHLAPVSVRLA